MKTLLLLIFTSFLVFGCKVNEVHDVNTVEADKSTIFDGSYTSINDFEEFGDYQIVADTFVHSQNFHPQFSLQEITKNNQAIIIFSKILNAEDNFSIEEISTNERRVLDTLHISDVDANEIIITGCCTDDEKYGEEIIAIAEQTEELYVQKVKRAWRANLENQKIEEIHQLDLVECINKDFQIDMPEPDLDAEFIDAASNP